MPNSLAEATAAPAAGGIIPGYVLSSPAFSEFGRAEREFRKLYLEAAADYLKALPGHLQDKVASKPLDDIRDGLLNFGRRAHTAFATSAEGVYILAWISLTVKHPQLKISDAVRLVNENNADNRVSDAVWDLWTYRKPAPTAPAQAADVPIEWDKIIQKLMLAPEQGGHGLTQEQVNAMTPHQAFNLLADHSPKRVSPADIAQAKADARHAMFDRIAAKLGKGPSDLADASIDEWQTWVNEERGGKAGDLEGLAGHVLEWVAIRRGSEQTTQ